MSVNEYNMNIEACVKAYFDEAVGISDISYVGGGDINEARCIELSNGESIFVKFNSAANKSFFEAEEKGLHAIALTDSIRTPKILFRGLDKASGKSFFAMEYISGAGKKNDFWEMFGRNLASMHLSGGGTFVSEGRYGFDSDNYIGATRQINSPRSTWIDFFRECRLEPQFRMAEDYFDGTAVRCILKLLDRFPDLLVEPKQPSLLHGDLWSGNYIVGNDGEAWLIDPAVYVGHSEADLAMTELFGRFPAVFYEAYSAVNPIESGYSDRRDLYNLYHLINHLNLFGGTYYPAVMRIVGEYVK
ncbi:MAG: fructosamine kinase family protein [Eubacterium sp.]|nr:fructosamine kinase family protein [Eubacterium sp.]